VSDEQRTQDEPQDEAEVEAHGIGRFETPGRLDVPGRMANDEGEDDDVEAHGGPPGRLDGISRL
jgi:hypothetical protein